MRTVYVDSEFKCHTVNDGTMREVENSFFDGKCDAFIEGHCYDDSDGYIRVYPWKRYSELDAAQRAYEREQLATLQAENEALVSDMAQMVEEIYQSDTEMMGL